MSWGPPIPWSLDRDPDAKPDCVKSGDVILSDLIVRPHMAEWLELRPGQYPPEICKAATWHVITGQSFQLAAPQGLSVHQQATHTVLSYFRIWQGGTPPLCLAYSQDRPWGATSPTKTDDIEENQRDLEIA